MKREIITIPPNLLRLQTFDWSIDWRGQKSGETNIGGVQTVFSAFPQWVGSLDFKLFGPEILDWRAIHATAMGEINLYSIEMFDPLGFNYRTFAPAYVESGIPHSTGPLFSTGSGYSYEPFVICAGGFSAGSSTLVVETPTGIPAPIVGQIMSYDTWPFLVTSVTDLGGSSYSITIKMPLRTDVPDGGLISLRARGLFYAVDSGGGNPGYGRNKLAANSMKLVEYLNR